jgi:N-acetyl-anhydromuramyl-L-alanine amidase AmpD
MKIIKNPLETIEFFTEKCVKTQIVLHHTVSRKGYGKNVKDGFSIDKGKSKIAVPYILDADGTIYEIYSPENWSYHLGIPHIDNVSLCKKSIAIEIVNEGTLQKKGEDYFWFDGKYKYLGEIFFADWRGEKYFAKYTNEQVIVLAELIKELCNKFNIKKDLITNFDYDIKYTKHEGIINHANVRLDKTDLHPGFPLKQLEQLLKG